MDKNIPFSIKIPTSELLKSRAGNINSISWGSRYGGSSNTNYNMRLGIAWSSVAKSGYSEVTARLWVESNWVYHDGVNVYTNDSGSKTYGKVRVWNGSEWVQGYVSVWTGSAWSTTK